MFRLKFFIVFVLVAFAVGFIAFTNASIAGGGFVQNFELKPPYLSGQTCDDNGGPCAEIDYCDNEEIVSQVNVFTAKPGKIRIDFCAEFDTENCGTSCDEEVLGCAAFVDNNEAQPGLISLGEAVVKDESRCFTWYAPVSGNYQTHTTQVRCVIECEECQCDVDIDGYTHSVFFNKL